MLLTFIETPLFSRLLPEYLDDEAYRTLQQALLVHPESGNVIPGTGGFRKIRWHDIRRGKGTPKMSTKRKLLDELMEGVDAMRRQRQGKITLKTHAVDDQPPLQIDAETIRDTRERLHVSRAVFARRLRVSTRTLENWEQGRAQPNAQAAALILLVREYPDTLKRLQALGSRAA